MSEHIEFLIGIVPYIHMEFEIDDASDNEFNGSNDCTSGKTAQEETFCFHLEICEVQRDKGNTACQSHGPMRESAKHHFNEAVENSPYTKNHKQFFCVFHHITAIRMTCL